jgi:hypothetical protein
MTDAVVNKHCDSNTPDEVEIRRTAREPVTDPTLGIEVRQPWKGTPTHRLVTIGDSLTHGFQSGAIFNTDLSYPAIIAHELGWGTQFRYPRYGGPGGLPLNIELLLRELEHRFGRRLDWWEVPMALFHARQLMDQIEIYWERGPGATTPAITEINHNLAVYGWDLRDALALTAKRCADEITAPKDNWLRQMVEHDGARAALRVLPAVTDENRSLTVFGAARKLGQDIRQDDASGAIETLIIALGANNALKSVVKLCVVWSDEGFDDLDRKRSYTVWRPSHFKAELDLVADDVRTIKARHVIWCTVPHVTIAPIVRGVGSKVEPGSRYYPYYTRPWISDRDFDPRRDPHLTSQQARAIDSAIDQYNDYIVAMVAQARGEGRDWYVYDTAGLVDRLASRRYIEDPLARPDWWWAYPLPPELQALTPIPDSLFLASDGTKRSRGGLFSLDGVHPTTVGYGIFAQELINVMRRAGVEFYLPDSITARPDPVTVDFGRLLQRDTLINQPPANLTSALGVLGWADQTLDVLRRTLFFTH